MIEKERLEELIEQSADIWKIEDGKVYPLRKDHYEYWRIKEDRLEWYWKIVPSGFNYISFEHLFETKEDAEEYAEFGNITRTERLELNNYETFLKSNTGTMFYLNACEHLLHKVRHSADDENPDWRIEVCVFYNDLEESSEVLYSKPLTRENYNEARRLCIKLFKGEEV